MAGNNVRILGGAEGLFWISGIVLDTPDLEDRSEPEDFPCRGDKLRGAVLSQSALRLLRLCCETAAHKKGAWRVCHNHSESHPW